MVSTTLMPTNENTTDDHSERPARFMLKDGEEPSALFAAIGRKNTPAALELIQRSEDCNWASKDGETCLMRACCVSDSRVVHALVASGADVNARAEDGDTALHRCITSNTVTANRKAAIVSFLLDNGCRVTANRSGYSPFLIAARNGDKELCHELELLLDHVPSTGFDASQAAYEKVSMMELLGCSELEDSLLHERTQLHFTTWLSSIRLRDELQNLGLLKSKQVVRLQFLEGRTEFQTEQDLNWVISGHSTQLLQEQILLVKLRLLNGIRNENVLRDVLKLAVKNYQIQSQNELISCVWDYIFTDMNRNWEEIHLDQKIQQISLISTEIQMLNSVNGYRSSDVVKAKQSLFVLNSLGALNAILDKLKHKELWRTKIYYRAVCRLVTSGLLIGDGDFPQQTAIERSLQRIALHRSHKSGYGILHYALNEGVSGPRCLEHKKRVVIELLLGLGADPHQVDRNGWTAMATYVYSNIGRPHQHHQMHLMLDSFVSAGFHLDAYPSGGVCVLTMLKLYSKPTLMLKSYTRPRVLPLQCLAARKVNATYSVNDQLDSAMIPKHLLYIVRIHK